MNDIKVVEYEEFLNQMEALEDGANFLPEVSTEEGYAKSKRIHLDYRKIEISIEKERVKRKKHWIDGGKNVDSEASKISDKIKGFRLAHMEAYQAVDRAKKERERLRTEKLNERVEYIRTLPELLADSCSDEILPAMDAMQSEECLDFYEFTELALKARNATCKALADLYASKLKSEQEAEELERLRNEAAKREQADREERIRKEASAKAEQEKLAAENREREAVANAERLKREAEQAEERRIEAEKQAIENAKIAAENARLAEVKRQADIVEAERVEAAKREANTKHIGIVRKAAKESLMLCGIDEATAKKIVLAIHNNKIPNVSIKY